MPLISLSTIDGGDAISIEFKKRSSLRQSPSSSSSLFGGLHSSHNKSYKKPVVIGVLARFVAKKGVDVFINSIKILQDKNYEIQAVIGGNGEEQDNITALVNKLNLQNKISFTGWVNDKDKFFEQIDIFCLPSLHEPFGIILLEAMENSLPIVSTDTEGPSEILKHMQDVLICKADSPEDLAEKITYLIDNQQKAKELSQKAYLKLTQTYNIKIISEKLVTLLHSLKIVS